MRIVSSFLHLTELAPLAKAGADEVYCAVKPIPSFGHGAVLRDMPALKKAVRRAHSLGLKISLAVNSVIFSFDPSREDRLLELLAEADDAGVDNFIAANTAIFALFSKLKRVRAGLHLSSVQPCFNSLTADLFIKLGVSRIILPNQLSPFEARKIIKLCRSKGVETEIFDYRFFGCAYVNGRCYMDLPDHCTFNPGYSGGTMCHPNLQAGGLPAPRVINPDPEWKPRLGGIIQRFSDRFAYGTTPRISNPASFFDFFSGGVDYLKYGIRMDSCGDKLKKVRELRVMLDLAENISGTLPRQEARLKFIEKMSKWFSCRL